MNENELSRNQLTHMAVGIMGLKPKSPVYPTTHQMFYHCPNHIDKTPSLRINFDMGVYYCFSCGSQGSIEKLFREQTGENLYKVLGISTDKFASFPRIQKLKTVHYEQEDMSLKNVYLNYDPKALGNIRDYPECIGYLRKRGIPLRIADAMGFRYIDEPTKINDTEFTKRLAIPIYEKDRLISIEGRRIGDTDGPKVLYPKNCTVNTLFDYDHLNPEETVYAVEGLMDLAILRTSDFFSNSTAIFGASITKRQLHMIKDFKKFVYIPDNDEAGNRTVAKLKDSGLSNVYILHLPEDYNGVVLKDVGDFPKASITPDALLNRRWLEYETLLDN